MPTRLVVDYTAGARDGQFPGVSVVAPGEARQRFGDPPSRTDYVEAFKSADDDGPWPVICLVGPYGESPAFTAASAARNELGRHNIDPNRVSVHNTGRAFLGISAIAASLADAGLEPAEALRWLDEGASTTSTWLVARTEALAGLPDDWHVEAPGGLPTEEFSLLRVRLSSRVVAGFSDVRSALREARVSAGIGGDSVAVVAPGLGVDAVELLRLVDARDAFEVGLPAHLRAAFGDCAAFAVAPWAGKGGTNA